MKVFHAVIIFGYIVTASSTFTSYKLLDECPEHSSHEENIIIVDPKNCNTYFTCRNGHRILNYCPSGLHFDPKLMTCNYPDEAGCQETTTQKPTTTTQKPITTTEEPTQTPEKICAENIGHEKNIIIANPKDCNTYFTCRRGHSVLNKCPNELHFDPILMTCNYPEDAGCQQTTTQKPTTQKPTTTTEESAQTPGKICAENIGNEEHIIIANPKDCDTYFTCRRGYPVLNYCPNGLHFDPKLLTCNYPEVAGCDKTITQKPTTQKPTTTTQRPTENPNPTYPVKCPIQTSIDDDILLVNPHDCGSFYHCSYGIPYLKKCYPGLHFNDVKKRCDWPKETGCTIS